MRVRTALTLASLLPCSLFHAGCVVAPYHTVYSIHWSPNASALAYVRVEGIGWSFLPYPFFGGSIASSAHVRWTNLAEGDGTTRSREVDSTVFLEPASPYTAFSPDSRRLAVASGWHVWVIDLETGGRREISCRAELVTCVFWDGPEHVVYVSTTGLHRDGEAERSQRAVWRQRADGEPGERSLVYRQTDVIANASDTEPRCYADGSTSGFRMEWPSPDGRYVVLVSTGEDGEFVLLNVETSRSLTVGRCRRFPGSVVWKPDCTAVVCAGLSRPTLLVHTGSGCVEDLSREIPRCPHVSQPIDPQWTADGKYVIAQDSRLGWCLFEPDAGETVPVGRRVRDRLWKDDTAHRDTTAQIERFPAPGWVVAWTPNGYCVTDYEARRIVRLEDVTPWRWRFSPDGRFAARVREDGEKVEVRPIILPLQDKADSP